MPQKTYGSGANAVPMGKLHPILAAKRQDGGVVGQPVLQRPPPPPVNYGLQPHPPPPMVNNAPPSFQIPPLPPQAFAENVNNGAQKRTNSDPETGNSGNQGPGTLQDLDRKKLSSACLLVDFCACATQLSLMYW